MKISDIKIELNPYDGKNILLSICNDSIFLQKYDVTDYSLLIFINKYKNQMRDLSIKEASKYI